MAINWTKLETAPDGRLVRGKWHDDGTSHEGLVMSASWTKQIRVMSDVWENATYCLVWDPNTETAETITLHISDMSSRRGVVSGVDADPAIIAAYEAELARKDEVRRVAEEGHRIRTAEAAAERELKDIQKGCEVIVVKGRKVPVGTRVGLELAGKDKLTYTALSNCDAVIPGLEPGDAPEGGWVELLESVRADERARAAVLPKRGDRVRILADGTEGTVFWVRDGRYGIDPRPAGSKGRCETPIWADESEIVDVNGTIAPMPEALTPASPVADLAYPYNAVRTMHLDGGIWKAFSKDGVHLLDLTAEGALNLLSRTSEIRVG